MGLIQLYAVYDGAAVDVDFIADVPSSPRPSPRTTTRQRLHPTHTPPLMDRLIETIAEYLCRHRSVGLLRLTYGLTRRRLDLFAEVGAVEVVRGAVAPPTPGTDAWWRAVATVREAVYVLRERGLVQYVREVEVANWTALLTNPPLQSPTAKNGVLSRLFSFFSFFGAPKNGVSSLPNSE